MNEYILSNGIKLICGRRENDITSFCIGFNAGALEENGFNYGVAHAVEHMVFKGTTNRTEREINRDMDEVFGFNNAMTNYPYVIYYGTVNSADFEKAFKIYSDVVINPTFPEEGFMEEIRVIREELRDWREDPNQRCEDILLSKAFSERRIKELIIGCKESIDRINIEELRRFYFKYYNPGNCVVTVITSLEPDYIYNEVNGTFGQWNREGSNIEKVLYENNKPGVFIQEGNIEGAKVQFCYKIDHLSWRELRALYYFNIVFGEGTSSILYDGVRTENALAYEVGSSIKNERGIKLFSINVSTSKEKVKQAIEIVQKCVEKSKLYEWDKNANLDKIEKRLSLRENLSMEKSIELCKKLTTYHLMYGDYKFAFESHWKYEISADEIKKVIEKVFIDPSIQIFTSDKGVIGTWKESGC